MGIILVLIGLFLIFCIVMLIRSINKEKSEGESLLADIHQQIDSTYREFFGDDTHSKAEKLDRLFSVASKKITDAQQAYFTMNAIKNKCESYSDLKYCAISETHFYIDITNWAGNLIISEVISAGSLRKPYENLVSLAQNRICTFPQERRSLKNHIEDTLFFYSQLNKEGCTIEAEKIAMDDIVVFRVEGQRHISTNISDAGPNLGNAVAGALIAGDAGAIIGSRVGVQQVTTTTTVDDRKILLIYNTNGTVVTREIRSNDKERTIEALRKLIPQKEESIAKLHAQEKEPNIQNSLTDELKRFKELLDSGVITQEEFDAKKKQLLGL